MYGALNWLDPGVPRKQFPESSPGPPRVQGWDGGEGKGGPKRRRRRSGAAGEGRSARVAPLSTTTQSRTCCGRGAVPRERRIEEARLSPLATPRAGHARARHSPPSAGRARRALRRPARSTDGSTAYSLRAAPSASEPLSQRLIDRIREEPPKLASSPRGSRPDGGPVCRVAIRPVPVVEPERRSPSLSGSSLAGGNALARSRIAAAGPEV